jgi:predicted enzyme related to lactoylglutathione lyase
MPNLPYRRVDRRAAPATLASSAPMQFEHFALNVPDTRAHAAWYVAHVGFTVARQQTAAPYTTFLADSTGRTVIELYTNPNAAMTDFPSQHPLVFHFAVVSTDARADCTRLQNAGATVFLEAPQPDGSTLIMLRDPWGVALQLCQRTHPF